MHLNALCLVGAEEARRSRADLRRLVRGPIQADARQPCDRRLRSTDEKVLAVAMQCGFSDAGYFNRKFKAFVGASPRAYRRRFGAEAP
ncbi:MAG: helix-turn-helix domain-containing protein [Kiritimatiellae bacterium]|nr:helix-turn-helix domain-containing protein [Kiritimatiellia bacterium]